ncbi:MAG: hypothetical protein HFF73_06205 [Oscillospiraceae bacterium]|nr:hypothetical protein [Oscillospiraceae bacterium]
MFPTGIIDLHCDTLTRDMWASQPPACGPLVNPAYHIALGKMPRNLRWVQCFAIFVPDNYRGQDAIDFFDRYRAVFDRQMVAHGDKVSPCRSFSDMEQALEAGKFAAVLTVEGGAALAGQPERAQVLRDAGVRMLTLTWNGPNELGSGHDSSAGLTACGREAVAELERCGVLVDVSHLNDRGFEDLLSVAKKPFVASHSNARSVCGHRRNLPDAFIREIADRGGLIGLNYSKDFLSDSGRGNLDDLYRHVCRFLELDAGACLALGSDFDGTDIHPDLDSVEKSLSIYGYLTQHGIPADTADGILFGNAWRFFKAWL